MRAVFRAVLGQGRLRDPLFLLVLAAGLIAFVVQSGELGSADTMHRLQSTHAFWTSEPPVFPNEYPEFGIHGRGGQLQSWYGIGQSLLMLPADLIGTAVEKLPLFANYNGNDPSVRNIVVTYLTNTLISVLTAIVCFRFLRQLGFTVRQSVAGVLALLVATTHLHYTQNMMENNYICLLTLTGFSYELEWLQTGSRRALLAGSAAFGLNLLTRLTTGLDLMTGVLFLLLVMGFRGVRGREFRSRCVVFFKTAVPVFVAFGILDRLYQFYRFGSFTNTYVSVVTAEARQRDPSLPAKYPFETPFHVGFLGGLFTPEKSIFLFDPLIVLAIIVIVLTWKRCNGPVRAYVIATALMLLAYLSFYARYTVWSGDFAWGDRYVSTAVELVALPAVPLLLRFRRELGRGVFGTGVAILAISTVIQIASLAIWFPLEIYQMETRGHPTCVIWLRFRNIAAMALEKMSAWGLTNVPMTQDPWDYVHITTWNILPCLLKRVGAAPAWAVHMTFAVWWIAMLALVAVVARLWWALRLAAKTPAERDAVAEV